MNALDILQLLSPELILALTGFVVVSVDLAMRRRDEGRTAATIALLGLGGALVATLLLAFAGTSTVEAFTLAIDPYSLFFKALAIVSVGLVILASISFMRGKSRYLGEYYALLVFAALAISLAVSATNLVMVYLGIEFLSITSYILASYFRQDLRSQEAGVKYFLYGAVAGAVMLYGISLLYGATGSVDLATVGALFSAEGDQRLLGIAAIILLLAGFGFKASLVPFHQWAPDTYEGAPTPITAFLSTASKAAGFAVAGRVFMVALPNLVADWTAILGSLAILSMTLGNLVALKQTNLKRLLAYSSIAQAGYIVLGLAALNPGGDFDGVGGLLIYLLAYLFTNIGAFLVVMAIEQHSGSVDLAAYNGLIKRAPALALWMTLFLLSLAGIPPLAGFFGKFFVFAAVVERNLLTLAAIAAVNAVVAAFYYLNIVRAMFFVESEEQKPVSVAAGLSAALAISGIMVLVIGIAAQPFITWISRSVEMVLVSGM
ncbi:MAG: NADH-quinone oxidoreductase subunit N [Caldilineales bacterium]|nr:NADH-quinone oxidoreductase subunit N [Caldilineales bacterium]